MGSTGPEIVALTPVERGGFDVLALVGRAGERSAPAPDRIGPEIRELSVKMAALRRARDTGDRAVLSATARIVADHAAATGLPRLARVAGTVSALVQRDDDAALAANLARLDRLFRATVSEIRRMIDAGP